MFMSLDDSIMTLKAMHSRNSHHLTKYFRKEPSCKYQAKPPRKQTCEWVLIVERGWQTRRHIGKESKDVSESLTTAKKYLLCQST